MGKLQQSLEWLKGVAGLDDEYLARFPSEAWEQWALAMHADGRGLNPTVPLWMQPVLGPWHHDFSGPFPCIAQLWPTGHDWFTEADVHDDFTLTVEGPLDHEPPTLVQLRDAWTLTRHVGATPLANVSVVPAEPWGHAVAGEIEAFYAVGLRLEDGPLAAQLNELLGFPGSPRPYMPRDGAHALQLAGLPAVGYADRA